MNKDEYIKKVNNNLILCWGIITLVLTVSYIIEILKGLRSIEYVILFISITAGPLLLTVIVNKITKGTNENLKYVAAFGYCFFYTFSLLSAQSLGDFVYIIPMMSVLIVYTDIKIIDITYGYSTILNLVYVLISIFIRKQNQPDNITFYEIEMACIILSWLFLRQTLKLVKMGNEKLFELSEDINKDELTGAYNRKFFSSNIDNLFSNCDEDNGLCLAFIDIDDFKQFNTNHGHNFGDVVLKHICHIIEMNICCLDKTYLIRMGGDEFIIVGDSLSHNDFHSLMEKISNDISTSNVKENVNVSVSIGIANNYIDECVDYWKLYKTADENSYKAKNSGKNTVV